MLQVTRVVRNDINVFFGIKQVTWLYEWSTSDQAATPRDSNVNSYRRLGRTVKFVQRHSLSPLPDARALTDFRYDCLTVVRRRLCIAAISSPLSRRSLSSIACGLSFSCSTIFLASSSSASNSLHRFASCFCSVPACSVSESGIIGVVGVVDGALARCLG
jgi:hypothetical protein